LISDFVLFCALVFVGCNIVGAFFTLLLPEVRGRDPDAILAQEIEEEKRQKLVGQ
jgi:PHS family inorganic phosphate transporter-like MFS transporter